MLRRLGQALFVIGTVGFLGTFCLPNAGTLLNGVELPAFFQTSTIALPDGGRLTATLPTQRVQRYDGDGRFQAGWFVDAHGGSFAVGLTGDGKIVVCTARRREILIYDRDGQLIDRRPCFGSDREIPRLLQPADIVIGGIPLRQVVPAERPPASLVALLLVPFWHPFVAWAIGLAGAVIVRSRRRPTARQSG